MVKWVYLFLGGGIGTMARYMVSALMYQWLGPKFPSGTLVVNLLGCFLVGFLAAIGEEKFVLSMELKLFLIVGFLGGFTTFSAFMLETAVLIKGGQSLLAFGNVVLSVIVGFFVFQAGILLAEII